MLAVVILAGDDVKIKIQKHKKHEATEWMNECDWCFSGSITVNRFSHVSQYQYHDLVKRLWWNTEGLRSYWSPDWVTNSHIYYWLISYWYFKNICCPHTWSWFKCCDNNNKNSAEFFAPRMHPDSVQGRNSVSVLHVNKHSTVIEYRWAIYSCGIGAETL